MRISAPTVVDRMDAAERIAETIEGLPPLEQPPIAAPPVAEADNLKVELQPDRTPGNSNASWKIFRLGGLRDEAKGKVDAVEGVPDDVKAFIKSEIDLLPPECRAVKVDAYGAATDHRSGNDHVTRNSRVSVIGLKL